jgi:hypothetical protein
MDHDLLQRHRCWFGGGTGIVPDRGEYRLSRDIGFLCADADDVPLRFEIVREARISLAGRPDPSLGVPRLSETDRVAEKLLANADRCQDRATACRDAIDLGMDDATVQQAADALAAALLRLTPSGASSPSAPAPPP